MGSEPSCCGTNGPNIPKDTDSAVLKRNRLSQMRTVTEDLDPGERGYANIAIETKLELLLPSFQEKYRKLNKKYELECKNKSRLINKIQETAKKYNELINSQISLNMQYEKEILKWKARAVHFERSLNENKSNEFSDEYKQCHTNDQSEEYKQQTTNGHEPALNQQTNELLHDEKVLRNKLKLKEIEIEQLKLKLKEYEMLNADT